MTNFTAKQNSINEVQAFIFDLETQISGLISQRNQTSRDKSILERQKLTTVRLFVLACFPNREYTIHNVDTAAEKMSVTSPIEELKLLLARFDNMVFQISDLSSQNLPEKILIAQQTIDSCNAAITPLITLKTTYTSLGIPDLYLTRNQNINLAKEAILWIFGRSIWDKHKRVCSELDVETIDKAYDLWELVIKHHEESHQTSLKYYDDLKKLYELQNKLYELKSEYADQDKTIEEFVVTYFVGELESNCDGMRNNFGNFTILQQSNIKKILAVYEQIFGLSQILRKLDGMIENREELLNQMKALSIKLKNPKAKLKQVLQPQISASRAKVQSQYSRLSPIYLGVSQRIYDYDSANYDVNSGTSLLDLIFIDDFDILSIVYDLVSDTNEPWNVNSIPESFKDGEFGNTDLSTSGGSLLELSNLTFSDISVTFDEVGFFESSPPPNDTTEVASHSYSDHGNNYADSSPSTTYDSTPTYSEPPSYDSGSSYDSSSSGGNSLD